jgi:tetratricopeptide (TPR) repeat protein
MSMSNNSNSKKHNPRNNLDRESLIAGIPRDGIECDVCGTSDPAHQCRKCYTVYYCSSQCLCKLQHDCHEISKMRNALVGLGTNSGLNDDLSRAKNGEECGICLDSFVDPIVLEGCHHAFCTKCLQEWHKMEKLKVCESCTCPLCRGPTVDSHSETHLLSLEKAKLLGARAKRMKSKDDYYADQQQEQEQKQQQEQCCESALQELETVLSKDASNVQALFTKAEILMIQSRPQDALEVLETIHQNDGENRTKRNKVTKYLDKVQAAMERGDTAEEERLMTIVEEIAGSRCEHLGKVLDGLVDVLLMRAEAHQEMGEWNVARDIYKDLLGLGSGIPNWVLYSLLPSMVVYLFTYLFVFDRSSSSSSAVSWSSYRLVVRQVATAVICASLVYGKMMARLFPKKRATTTTLTSTSTTNVVLRIPLTLRKLSVPQERHCYMQLIRCYYELGDYKRAIRAGGRAIQMNRHFPGVHEYVAKAYKAKDDGDPTEAIRLMRRAVLYETPWDTENIANQLKLLKELLLVED